MYRAEKTEARRSLVLHHVERLAPGAGIVSLRQFANQRDPKSRFPKQWSIAF